MQVLVVIGVALIAALSIGLVLAVDYGVMLIYDHFALRFHWPTISFWETVLALVVISIIGSFFRSVFSEKKA